MKIHDKNLLSVNVKNDICWYKFWCDVKQQEIKELAGHLYLVFYKKCLQDLKYNVQKEMHFSFNFAWCSIQLGFEQKVVYNMRWFT